MYSILKDEELDEAAEEDNPAEHGTKPQEAAARRLQRQNPARVLRLHHHRRMPPLHLQPLAAGPRLLRRLPDRPHRHADNRTYGFFKKNVVSEYTHEKAVADGVNVGNEIYIIETEVTQKGGTAQGRTARREAREADPQASAGSSRTKTRPIPPSSSTATSSIPTRSAPSSGPSGTSCPRSSPAATKSPRPSSSPRPTATPTTSSRSSARSSARATTSAKRSPTRPTKTRNPSSPSSATTTTRASPSPWT